MVPNDTQPTHIDGPIDLTPLGMLKLVNDEHSMNKPLPSDVTVSGMLTLTKFVDCRNTFSPIDVIPCEMITFTAGQPANAPSTMDTTPLGMMTV